MLDTAGLLPARQQSRDSEQYHQHYLTLQVHVPVSQIQDYFAVIPVVAAGTGDTFCSTNLST